MNLNSLLQNVRFYLLIFASFLAGFIYLLISSNSSDEAAKILSLTRTYALTAVTFLYLTLFASPYAKLLTFMPFRGMYIKARRALGVSAFLFALLHAYFAFFKVIGVENFMSLSLSLRFSIFLGSTSLFILFLMTATATDFAIYKLTFPRWKMLHRLIYLVAILVVVHAMRIGSDFADLSGTIPAIFFLAGTILLILEAIRFVKYLKTK